MPTHLRLAPRPTRVVFDSNGPHPQHYPIEVNAEDGDLIDLTCDWFPDAAVRERISVTNPAQLTVFFLRTPGPNSCIAKGAQRDKKIKIKFIFRYLEEQAGTSVRPRSRE